MDRLLLMGVPVIGWCLLALQSSVVVADRPTSHGSRHRQHETIRQAKAETAKAEKRASQQAADQAVIERLIGQLQIADATTRATTARALGAKGLASHPAIEPLAACLNDDQDYVRVAAEWAIARIAQSVVIHPEKLTRSEQQQCLRYFRIAGEALGQRTRSTECGVKVSMATHQLSAMFPDEPQLAFDTSTPFSTVRSLPKQSALSTEATPDQLLSQLQKAIESDSRVEMCRTALALKRHGAAGLKPLLTVLESTAEYSAVQEWLVDAVSSYGAELETHLRPWLQSHIGASSLPTSQQRQLALRVVQSLGAQANVLLPDLIQILRSEQDVLELRNLVLIFAGMGEEAASATAELLAILSRSQDSLLSHDLIAAFEAIAPKDSQVLEALARLARDDAQPFDLRLAATEFVFRQQPAATEWTPMLLDWLSQCQPSANSDTQEPAPAGLEAWRIDSSLTQVVRFLGQEGQVADSIVPRLVPLLDHADGEVRREAAQSLATYGPASAPALTSLLRRVRDESSPETFKSACHAIRAIGPDALNSLLAGLHSFDQPTRDGTYRAVAELGVLAKEARGLLMERAAQADDHAERAAAIRCLGQLKEASTSEIDSLIAWTVDDQLPLSIRCASAVSLGELQRCSKDGGRQLVALLGDENQPESLRVAIAETLSHLGSEYVPVLQTCLGGPDRDNSPLAAAAACGLIRMENRDVAVIRCLLQNLDQDRVGIQTRDALSRVTADSIPILEQIAADRHASATVRENAIARLARFEDAGVSALVRLLHEDEVASQNAADALGNLSWPILPELFEFIAKSDATGGPSTTGTARTRAEEVISSLFIGGRGAGDAPAASVAAEPEDTGGGSSASSRAIGVTAKATGSSTPAKPRWETVKVFFGTNREALSGYQQRRFAEFTGFIPAVVTLILTTTFIVVLTLFRRGRWVLGVAASGLILAIIFSIPATRRAFHLERAALTRPGPVYGPQNANRIELGSCEVSIPATHSPGHLEAPQFLSLEFEQDPSKHIIVQSVTPHSHVSFYADLQQKMHQRGPSLLVFIHGYNVDFDDAARRTAQMAYDLKFPGAPVFFSWPSQGNWHQYRADEREVQHSIADVKEFLVDLARTAGAKSIHLVAHSMGTRALSGALQEIQQQFPDQQPMFHQVVLAAPDIDAKVFREQIAPRIVGPATRVTLYASSNDLALMASRTFNPGGARAGDSHDPILAQGIETIDVSQVDTSLLGHSYYGSNPTVLTDLRELLATERPAEQRPGLEPILTSSLQLPYWMFRDRQLARTRGWSILR